jgi:hypothetical protein
MAPEGIAPAPTQTWEQFRHLLDQRIADHMEPLIARVGELERRLGHENRGDGRTLQERLEELERFERSGRSVDS